MTRVPTKEKGEIVRTEDNVRFKNLLSPGRIGNMMIKNRVVMPPMGTGYADDDGFVTERLARYYEARAEGGTGLIIVEVAAVAPEGRAINRQVAIWADKFIPGLRYLAQCIKKHGARAAIQLHHAGRQTTYQTTGFQPVAPSAMSCPICQDEPRELSVEEIKGLVDAFGHAARRAREAGFDAIEIHGTHGYLINQFLSPYSNRRNDEYGGDWDRRLRFPGEVSAAVRNAVGNDFPIIYRMNANEYMEGGLTADEGLKFAGLLQEWGVDSVHVSAGVYGSPAPMIATMSTPELPLIDYAAAIKDTIGIPVIAVGKFHDPEPCETALSDEHADFISIGRGLITDPLFVKKIEREKVSDIRKCIQCNQKCVDPLLTEGKPVSCIYNARVGKEIDFPFDKIQQSKKVVVVGGGPAGLEAARVAQLRGHEVVLFEQGRELGGQAILAEICPGKDRFGEILRYLIHRTEDLGVDIRKDTVATIQTILDEKPDAVILATGARPVLPNIPGLDQNETFTAWDVLERKATPGQRVAIIGGGVVGCETAEFLAEMGHQVFVLEMADELAHDQSPSLRFELLARLYKNPSIELRTGTTVNAFTPNSVIVSTTTGDDTIENIDTVILAVGAESYNPLEGELKEQLEEVYAIGDCNNPHNAGTAIHEAFHVAYRI